jgi:hypothetical protein
VKIPAAPGRKERTAELALRFSPVTLCRPHPKPAPDLPDTIRLTMVDIREVSANHEDRSIGGFSPHTLSQVRSKRAEL